VTQILCTGPGRFTGGELEAGKLYNTFEAGDATEKQNRLFHALVAEWFTSGCFSYPAKTVEELKDWIKKDLGAGADKRIWITLTEDGGVKKVMTGAAAAPPPGAAGNGRGGYIYVDMLKSWSRYTKAERRETIDRLISAMIQSGCNSRKFDEILGGCMGDENDE
jgi:hypothetical protein